MARVNHDRFSALMQMQSKSSSGGSFKEKLVSFSIPDNSPVGTEVSRTMRIIGFPNDLFRYSPKKWNNQIPNKRSPGKMGDWEEVPFPDADYARQNFTRIGTTNEADLKAGKCVWYNERFARDLEFVAQVLVYNDDGTIENKVFNKKGSLFQTLFNAEKANAAQAERYRKMNKPVPSALWELIGGEVAPTFTVTARKSGPMKQNIEYTLVISPVAEPLTDEEIEILKSTREITPEELEEIYQRDEAACTPGEKTLREYPEWFVYGHDIEAMFKPNTLLTEPQEGSAAHKRIHGDGAPAGAMDRSQLNMGFQRGAAESLPSGAALSDAGDQDEYASTNSSSKATVSTAAQERAKAAARTKIAAATTELDAESEEDALDGWDS